MKRIIDGKTCNTDTATTVARYRYRDHNGSDTEATLYVTKGGDFFAVHMWSVSGVAKIKTYIEALTREEVDKLAATENLEIINDKAFSRAGEKSATIYVRAPEPLKVKIDEAAKADGVSVNAWALRCFEASLARSSR